MCARRLVTPFGSAFRCDEDGSFAGQTMVMGWVVLASVWGSLALAPQLKTVLLERASAATRPASNHTTAAPGYDIHATVVGASISNAVVTEAAERFFMRAATPPPPSRIAALDEGLQPEVASMMADLHMDPDQIVATTARTRSAALSVVQATDEVVLSLVRVAPRDMVSRTGRSAKRYVMERNVLGEVLTEEPSNAAQIAKEVHHATFSNILPVAQRRAALLYGLLDRGNENLQHWTSLYDDDWELFAADYRFLLAAVALEDRIGDLRVLLSPELDDLLHAADRYDAQSRSAMVARINDFASQQPEPGTGPWWKGVSIAEDVRPGESRTEASFDVAIAKAIDALIEDRDATLTLASIAEDLGVDSRGLQVNFVPRFEELAPLHVRLRVGQSAGNFVRARNLLHQSLGGSIATMDELIERGARGKKAGAGIGRVMKDTQRRTDLLMLMELGLVNSPGEWQVRRPNLSSERVDGDFEFLKAIVGSEGLARLLDSGSP